MAKLTGIALEGCCIGVEVFPGPLINRFTLTALHHKMRKSHSRVQYITWTCLGLKPHYLCLVTTSTYFHIWSKRLDGLELIVLACEP